MAMTTARRPRFSVRTGLADADETLFSGVPDHLVSHLQKWLRSTLRDRTWGGGEEVAGETCLFLRIAPLEDWDMPYTGALTQTVGLTLLDVIDTVLPHMVVPPNTFPKISDTRNELIRILDAGGSAYCLNKERDGLEERVVPAVRDAISQAVSEAHASPSTGSAADHLATAWQKAYGLHPDPVKAYSEAIKAVESAAHALIEPKNIKATLGTMLRVIRDGRPKFTTTLSAPVGREPITVVEMMMQALWEGQTSRHGGQNGTVPEPLEAARASVHLAATLVQWFASGAVVRTP